VRVGPGVVDSAALSLNLPYELDPGLCLTNRANSEQLDMIGYWFALGFTFGWCRGDSQLQYYEITKLLGYGVCLQISKGY